jgi:hypothetical protein
MHLAEFFFYASARDGGGVFRRLLVIPFDPTPGFLIAFDPDDESWEIRHATWVHPQRKFVCSLGVDTVDTDGSKQRIDRLDQLSRGLAKEVVLMRAANDPLLYLERKAYLTAIQDALAGVEGARVALARARQRLERGQAEGRG